MRAGKAGEVGWKGSGRSTWHVPGFDLPQPLLLFDASSPGILVTRGDIMAESTGLGVPHGACGMGNPEVDYACTCTVRRAMSRCRSRCCPSAVPVAVPAWKVMDEGKPSLPFNRPTQPGRSASVVISRPFAFSPRLLRSSFFVIAPGTFSRSISGDVLVWRGAHVAQLDGREDSRRASWLIAADLRRVADGATFGGRGNYGSNPVSIALASTLL